MFPLLGSGIYNSFIEVYRWIDFVVVESSYLFFSCYKTGEELSVNGRNAIKLGNNNDIENIHNVNKEH